MKNETQLSRYKKLLLFIEEKFREDINIPEIEEACNYSYRNINRIFESLNHETIGKYIKRMRLERAAQYLSYSDESITEIAYEVGFGNVAAFSKAFKNRFRCSPQQYREGARLKVEINRNAIRAEQKRQNRGLSFEIESLPDLEVLGLEYKGLYEDLAAIEKTWRQLVEYVSSKKLLNDETIVLAEILDDDEISDQVHCRYNVAIVLEQPLNFEPEGFFTKKTIPGRRYAKFLHKGSHESSVDTYQMIYSRWMTEVQLEMADAPVLEFFLNDEANTPADDLLTEIYIPIA